MTSPTDVTQSPVRDQPQAEMDKPPSPGVCDFLSICGIPKEKMWTGFTLLVHWIHAVLITCNFIFYVRTDEEALGTNRVSVYLSFMILSNLAFYCSVSPFYMWAWRYHVPEEPARRHRTWGVIINLLVCDVPIFIVEVGMVWAVRFKDPLQALSFLWTCLSFGMSFVRAWIFFLVKSAKRFEGVVGGHSSPARVPGANYAEQPPQFNAQPAFAGGPPQYNAGAYGLAYAGQPSYVASPMPAPQVYAGSTGGSMLGQNTVGSSSPGYAMHQGGERERTFTTAFPSSVPPGGMGGMGRGSPLHSTTM